MNIKQKIQELFLCALERNGTNEAAELPIVIAKFRKFCYLVVMDLLEESLEDLCTFACYALNLLIANPERGIPYYREE